VPQPSAVTEPYWDAARQGRFVVQGCGCCDRLAFPPRPTCPSCGAAERTWVPVSGEGVVHTFTIARRPTHPAFAGRVPYVIAVVELAEGPKLTSNVVGCDPALVHIGMRVVVEFEVVGDDAATVLPVFRPDAAEV
jgi:uncharacterized OB-fold protein